MKLKINTRNIQMTSTIQRSISSTQIKNLARIITNQNNTAAQKRCPYCHPDRATTDCLKGMISEHNHFEKMISFESRTYLPAKYKILDLSVLYAGRASSLAGTQNLVCLAKIKFDESKARYYCVGFDRYGYLALDSSNLILAKQTKFNESKARYYCVGFDRYGYLMPAFEEINYCPKCGRYLAKGEDKEK